jgi:hypothetical protein
MRKFKIVPCSDKGADEVIRRFRGRLSHCQENNTSQLTVSRMAETDKRRIAELQRPAKFAP